MCAIGVRGEKKPSRGSRTGGMEGRRLVEGVLCCQVSTVGEKAEEYVAEGGEAGWRPPGYLRRINRRSGSAARSSLSSSRDEMKVSEYASNLRNAMATSSGETVSRSFVIRASSSS